MLYSHHQLLRQLCSFCFGFQYSMFCERLRLGLRQLIRSGGTCPNSPRDSGDALPASAGQFEFHSNDAVVLAVSRQFSPVSPGTCMK